MWVPKSALIKREVGYNFDETYNHEILFISDYEECLKDFRNHWNEYK